MDSNFFQRYMAWAEKLTDAPVEFHQFMAYAVMSMAFGRDIYFPFGGLNIYPNLYMTFIAPSSVYRKSTALSLGARVIRTWKHERILPAEFSQERLLEIMEKTPQGAFIFYEFKTLLGLLEKDYMQGTKAFLTEIFDNPPTYKRETKSSQINIIEPCISIISATTMSWFMETARKGDLEGGFLTRFIFIPADKKIKSMALPPEMDETELNKLVIWIEDTVKNVKGKMHFSDTARELYEQWYHKGSAKLERDENEIFKSSAARLQIYVIKFAMLNSAVFNRSTIIDEKCLQEAINNVEWLMRNVENIIKNELSDSNFSKLIKKMIRHIERSGNGGIDARSLLQKMDVKATYFKEILDTLLAREEIKIEVEKTRGTPRRWVKLCSGFLPDKGEQG